jgi:hypothetical protein
MFLSYGACAVVRSIPLHMRLFLIPPTPQKQGVKVTLHPFIGSAVKLILIILASAALIWTDISIKMTVTEGIRHSIYAKTN